MALGNIKKTLEGVAKQVQRLQSLQGKATSGLANWDCAFCPQGHNNFAHRTFCYKCSRDRTSGEVVGGAAVRQAAQGSIQGARARSRPARGQSSAPPPKAPDTEQAQSQEDDPIAIELAAARSYVEWVRKQKQVIRDKELPQAQKRLSEAEAKDKQRKPPAERLQSALSRVDHRQRLADQAREAASRPRRQPPRPRRRPRQPRPSSRRPSRSSRWPRRCTGHGARHPGPPRRLGKGRSTRLRHPSQVPQASRPSSSRCCSRFPRATPPVRRTASCSLAS